MLAGLDPEGIESFNELLGANHMLRPFRIERVTLESPHHPLAATLGNRDLALLSPNPLLHGRCWVSGNTFSYVIDRQDFAPFTRPPGAAEDPYRYQPTLDDHDPFNVTGTVAGPWNGLVGDLACYFDSDALTTVPGAWSGTRVRDLASGLQQYLYNDPNHFCHK